VLAQIGIWSRRYEPVDEKLAATSRMLKEGGPTLWATMMDELLQDASAESDK
jgi:hypothetical protein